MYMSPIKYDVRYQIIFFFKILHEQMFEKLVFHYLLDVLNLFIL